MCGISYSMEIKKTRFFRYNRIEHRGPDKTATYYLSSIFGYWDTVNSIIGIRDQINLIQKTIIH